MKNNILNLPDWTDPCSSCPFAQMKALQRNSQLLESDMPKIKVTSVEDYNKALRYSTKQVRKLTRHFVKMLKKKEVFKNPDTATIVGCFLLDTLSGSTRKSKQYAEIKTELSEILFTAKERRILDGTVPSEKEPSFSTTTLYTLLGFLFAYGIIENERGTRTAIIECIEPVVKSRGHAIVDKKLHAFSRLAYREIGGKIVVKESGYYFTRRMVKMIKAYCEIYAANK